MLLFHFGEISPDRDTEGNTMSEKRTLPLLPLRGLVVYPHMMVNLDVDVTVRSRQLSAPLRGTAASLSSHRRNRKQTIRRRLISTMSGRLLRYGSSCVCRRVSFAFLSTAKSARRSSPFVRGIHMPRQMFTRSRSRRIQPRRRILRLLSTGHEQIRRVGKALP